MRQQHLSTTATFRKSSVRMAILVAIAISLAVAILQPEQVQGQFFTKATKSIPRMGRRSEPADPNKEIFLESLAEDIGQLNTHLAIEAEPSGERLDIVPIFKLLGKTYPAYEQGYHSRYERSRPQANSLAMRALDTDQIMQHLSSGQPLVSYGRSYLKPASGSSAEQISKSQAD